MATVNREFIVAVAIKRNGKIFNPPRRGSHVELRRSMGDADPSRWHPGDVDGFVTNRGRFVTRKEAVPIAIEAGQLRGEWREATRDLLSSDFDW